MDKATALAREINKALRLNKATERKALIENLVSECSRAPTFADANVTLNRLSAEGKVGTQANHVVVWRKLKALYNVK